MTVDPNGLRDRAAPHVGGARSLGDLLDDALVQHKTLTALIEADRKREASRWTYRDVDVAARWVADGLGAAGVGADDRVAVLASNGPRWLVTAVAVFRRGAVLVPLDYKLEPREQRALLAHAKPAALVVEYGLWRALGGDTGDVGVVWVVDAPSDAELGRAVRFPEVAPGMAAPEHPIAAVRRDRDDVATIVYSSGTGGRAKGCVLTHGAYVAQLDGLLSRFPMAPGDRYFSVLPTNHAIDFMVGFVGPFVCGATVVHQRALRPEMLRFTLERYRCTHMAVVPVLLAAFDRAVRERLDALPGWQRSLVDGAIAVNAAIADRGPRHAVSKRLLGPIHAAFGGELRFVVCGGAFTEPALVERMQRLGIAVVVGYGLTEACTVVTVNGVRPPRADSVGRPIDHVEVRIDAPDPDGVGEVCVRGPTLMRGYLDDPALTAEVLRDGWLYTGDLGWMDASDHLHLCGRRKDVIVTAGGKNVYPEDVAYAFADAKVDEVAVFAANTLWPARTMVGEQLVLVVRADDVPGVMADLAARNRALPVHKRVAGVVAWGRAFPRTASMKVKRPELAADVGRAVGRDAVVALPAG